uniref:hypothetical protein n=1 Tax=Pedobacter schmidteae TaxID=2201271 RepID=UPI000EB2D3A5|nr:hypothetical protein [Pedobacter schmidteae]
MLKSICYKEWLKIGRIAIVLFIVGLLAIAGIYLSVRHDLVLTDAEKIWDMIINQKYIYFSIFKFFPLIFGLLIGVAQFVPEIMEKRIKLSLHLPLNEEEVVLKMVAFGAGTVVVTFFALFILFYGWGLVYFPSEIVQKASLTVLPWFLSGLTVYFLASYIILEPIWKYRIFYIITAAVLISIFYKSNVAGAYAPSIVMLVLCVLMASISSIFSIYRFRKGEM